MWNSWQELSKNPSEVSVKTVVTQTTENFAVTLNVISSRLEDIKLNSKDVIENQVFNLNKTLERVDSLNNQIYKSTIRNVAPNDLMDQRDLLLNEVSKSINIEVSLDKFNRATVSSSGQTLVAAEPEVEIENEISFVDSISKNAAGDYEVKLSLAGDGVKNPKTVTINASDIPSGSSFEKEYPHLTEGNVVFTKKNFVDKSSIEKFNTDELTGEIKGYNDSYNKIEEYSKSLDALANSIAQRVNIIHKEVGDTINAGQPFFTNGTGESDVKFSAKDIRVSKDIINNPENINADKIKGTYDGKRALAIASLRNNDFSIDDEFEEVTYNDYNSKLLSDYNSADLSANPADNEISFDKATDGASFDDYYTNLISNVGTEKQSADRMVDNEGALIEQLDLKKESISGVSLDEEIANLVQFQNAYAANAKVMSTLVEMLDTLMNNTGL